VDLSGVDPGFFGRQVLTQGSNLWGEDVLSACFGMLELGGLGACPQENFKNRC